MSDVTEGCHLVNKDEHEIIIAWAFPRDITHVSCALFMLLDFLPKKKFAVARSQMESRQVSPMGGDLDYSTLM